MCRWPKYLDLEETKKGIQIQQIDEDKNGNDKNEVSCWIEIELGEEGN